MKKLNSIFLTAVIISFSTASVVLLSSQSLFAQPPPQRTTAAEEEKAILKEKPYKEFEREPAEEEVEKPEKVTPPTVETEKKFFIKKIKVIGNTVIASESIEKITTQHENQELILNDLIAIANKITALYASKGYLTSQAYVPPQRIESQIVTIEVVEGEYGVFDIDRAKYTREVILEKRLKKKPHTVFNYNELRDDLLYLNENPDRIVSAAMLRGKLPRTTDFKIKVRDRPPVHFGYDVSNTGKKSSGLWRHTYRLEDTGLLLYDDYFLLRYIKSNGEYLRGFAANYIIPVNEFGSKLSSSVSHFDVSLGHDVDDLDIKSRSTTYSFNLQHPVLDLDNVNGKIDFGLDVKESRVEARSNFGQPVRRDSRDRLRVLKAGLTMDGSDKWGRSVVRNEISWQPHNFLGSCDNISHIDDTSRANADGTFVKANTKLSRVHRLPLSSLLLLNFEGQAANNLLYSSEQIRVGGMHTVRGYSEGEALGDYGANASAEVRFPFHFIPEDFHVYGVNARRAVQGVGFIDWGFAHQKSSTNSQTARHNEKLIGTGFGLRLNLLNCVNGRVDMAWPVGNESSYGREQRIHMNLTFKEPTLRQYEQILEQMMQDRIRRKLNEIAKNVPSEMVEMFEKALALEKEGRLEEAKELYVSLINRRNEIMSEAKSKINEAIQKEIEMHDYYKEAQQLYKKGEYFKARELFEKVTSMTEENQ